MSYEVEKHWVHNGYECVVICGRHRCGYVGITREHPLYGVGYGEKSKVLQDKLEWLKTQDIGKRGVIPCFAWDGESVSPEIYFNVHGSITFAGGEGKYPVNSDRWFYGFDCAHIDDNEPGGRSLEYCVSECESLADQLASVLP